MSKIVRKRGEKSLLIYKRQREKKIEDAFVLKWQRAKCGIV